MAVMAAIEPIIGALGGGAAAGGAAAGGGAAAAGGGAAGAGLGRLAGQMAISKVMSGGGGHEQQAPAQPRTLSFGDGYANAEPTYG